MNIRDLKYLVAVAKYRHFGKAADECFVSQPALSMQLKKLEEELGVQLFERTNKSVMITDVGIEIIERAKKILFDVRDIKEIAKTYHDPFSSILKMGAFPTLAPYLLPKIVPKINKKNPKLKLFLVEEKTEILIDKLKKGEIDTALLALPLPVEDASLDYEILMQDEFLIAVPKSHKFSDRKTISRNDLKGESLMLLEDGHCLRDQALDVCSMIGAKEQQEFRATSLETLRQMVMSNIGITLIPKIAKKSNDGLIYIPFDAKPPTRTIAMFWRCNSSKKSLCKAITEQIK